MNEQDKEAMEKELVQAVATFCGGFLGRCGDALQDLLTEQMKNSIRREVGAEIYQALYELERPDGANVRFMGTFYKGWDAAVKAAMEAVERITGAGAESIDYEPDYNWEDEDE